MISITANLTDNASALLADIQRTLANPEAIHLEIANHLKNITEDAFDRATSPFGERWQQSKPRRGKRSPKTLHDSTDLVRSISIEHTGASAAVLSTDRAYAAIHQFGGRTGRNRAVIMPRRSFMPISQKGDMPPRVVAEIAYMVADTLAE